MAQLNDLLVMGQSTLLGPLSVLNGRVGIGTSNPSYQLHVMGDIYANGGWLRTSGQAGWYNEDYGGGWYMTDSTYIRNYNSKQVLLNALLTVNSGVTNTGIKIGDTYLNAISEQVIFQNNGAIRFGGASWDWNNWAGLKYVHSTKTISLGIADGTVFNANDPQTGGILQFPGIQYIDCAGLIRASGGLKTNIIQAPTGNGSSTYGTGTSNQVLKANGSGYVYWGSADNVSISRNLTSGTKIATITINGTGTDLYCQTDTNSTRSGVAYCDTNGATAAKTATMPSFQLTTNQRILLQVINSNTIASGVTLSVNSTTAKPVKIITSNTSTVDANNTNFWAGEYIAYYDGTYWILTKADKKVGVYKSAANSSYPLLFGNTAVETDYDDIESNPKYTKVVACNFKIKANPNSGTIFAEKFNASSDIRLKQNLNILAPKKSILDLPIYKYDFINGAKNQIGCIAQDLQKICPEIVDTDENGYLSIQESKIVYLLIDEVKKLKEEIKALRGN